MIKQSFLLLFVILSLPAVARDSSGAGNGGDALICHDSPDYGDKVILLDTHEAIKRRLKLNLNPQNIEVPTHRSMVNTAVARLMKKDIATAELLYQYAMELVEDLEKLQNHPGMRTSNVYLGNDVVGEINDSLHVTIPIGCEIRQLVAQKKPKFKRDYRYEINKSIWDRMDSFEQAMTILHEAWYRIMIENDKKENHNSYGARYMNGLIASEDFDDYSFEEYLEELKETELGHYTVFNNSHALVGETFKLPLESISFQNGAACVEDFYLAAQFKKFGFNEIFNGIKTLKVDFKNVCFKDSHFTRITIPKKISEKGFLLSLQNYQLNIKANSSQESTLVFHSNGRLSHIENTHNDFLLKMFYLCNGKKTFKKENGCKGPYRFNESKISNPGDVFFSEEEEAPIGFNFPEL